MFRLLNSSIRSNIPRSTLRIRQGSLQQAPRFAYHSSSQNFATASSIPAKAGKYKKPNKSATALKRTAAESIPIRSNPNPTRSSIKPVFTFATAEKYNLDALEAYLPPSAVRFEESWYIPKWGFEGDNVELWVFGNGSTVCWGGGEHAVRTFVSNVLDKDPFIQIDRLEEAETEELEYVTDPTEETRLQGDLIILGQQSELSHLSIPETLNTLESSLPIDTLAARYAFAHALARSTALSALESSLDDYLSSVSRLPAALSANGESGLKRRELIQKLGQLLRLRQKLNLTGESFDETPDFYWTEPALENLFNSVSKALEMRARTRFVNDKITYAAELQSTLRELVTESTAHRMELIIIILIAVEVAVAFIRDGPELWQAIFGDATEHSTAHRKKH
ncbi:hypothetical protein FRC02_004703 [Tulasnella sp. 418]|nr:hypothetical protein FRC02_004703 [Tulasnella sp. 418]